MDRYLLCTSMEKIQKIIKHVIVIVIIFVLRSNLPGLIIGSMAASQQHQVKNKPSVALLSLGLSWSETIRWFKTNFILDIKTNIYNVFVDGAMWESSIVRPFIDDHRILHIVALHRRTFNTTVQFVMSEFIWKDLFATTWKCSSCNQHLFKLNNWF